MTNNLKVMTMVILFLMCLTLVVSATGKIGTVNTSVLNVRDGASLGNQIVGTLYYGDRVTIIDDSGEWCKISFGWQERYVYKTFLNICDENSDTNNSNDSSLTYIGAYKTTGYDPYCSHCCGKSNGITASGTQALAGRTVGMKGYPYGTQIYIEGIGYRTVEDTGGFASNVIDVACNGHEACYAVTGYRNVYLVS